MPATISSRGSIGKAGTTGGSPLQPEINRPGESGIPGFLIQCGARSHQAGCNRCIRMGLATATGKISLRTVPRNLHGCSGNFERQVYLCIPETAASAIGGVITDPRSLAMDYTAFEEPRNWRLNTKKLVPPKSLQKNPPLVKSQNIRSLPQLDQLPDELQLPILHKLGDDVSTDEILPR